jgi:hypothetical protein
MPTKSLDIAPFELVQAIILLKPRRHTEYATMPDNSPFYDWFSDDRLFSAFAAVPEVKQLVSPFSSTDGSSPSDISTSLENALAGLSMCHALVMSGDYRGYFVNGAMRPFLKKSFTETHGADALDYIKPLAEKVWAVYAKK